MVECVHAGKVISQPVTWTILISDRRVCVLHGRIVSISKSEVDTDLPTDVSVLRVKDGVENLSNIVAMIRLTVSLEDARDRM